MKTRIEEMIEMRKTKTLREIGEHFSISRERVRQLIGNTGRKPTPSREEIEKQLNTLPENKRREYMIRAGIKMSTLRRLKVQTRFPIIGGTAEKGQIAESMISKKLSDAGINNELMSTHNKYDILANGHRIDVKSCYAPLASPSLYIADGSQNWRFSIGKKKRGKYADFFILLIVPLMQTYVVPFDEVPDEFVVIVSPSKRITKYSKYLENLELLRK